MSLSYTYIYRHSESGLQHKYPKRGFQREDILMQFRALKICLLQFRAPACSIWCTWKLLHRHCLELTYRDQQCQSVTIKMQVSEREIFLSSFKDPPGGFSGGSMKANQCFINFALHQSQHKI